MYVIFTSEEVKLAHEISQLKSISWNSSKSILNGATKHFDDLMSMMAPSIFVYVDIINISSQED